MSHTLRSAGVTSIGTFTSRLLGLGRDVAMASFFGAGAAVDAFFMAFMIPNLFRALFGEGALSQIAIPALARVKETRPHTDAERLVSILMGILVLILAAITVIGCAGIWVAEPEWFGFEGDTAKWEQFRRYFTVLFPLVLCFCVAALQTGVLNTWGRFAVPSLMSALQNVLWISAIAFAVTLFPEKPIEERLSIVCAGILLGGLAQVAVQWQSMRNLGFHVRPRVTFRDENVREVGRAVLPVLLASGVTQINLLLGMVMAEWLVEGDGAVAAYGYANRFYQFPLGIVSIAMGTAIFPMLARYASRGEHEKVTGGLLNGIRLLMFIALPATAGLLILNDAIITSVYMRGEFSANDAMRSGRVLLFLSMGLPVVSASIILLRGFHAIGERRTPMRVALASVVVSFVTNYLLVQTTLEEAGIAAGALIASCFNLAALALILRRRLKGTLIESARLDSIPVSDRLAQPMSRTMVREFTGSLLRAGALSGAMAAGVWGALKALPPVERGDLQGIATTLGAVGIGMAVYAVLSVLFARNEIRELLRR